ncbi:hypothetical protein BH10PSE17_BH10PSE17_12180 [soil metagenome]
MVSLNFKALSKRERTLVYILVGMFVLMYLSHQPEWFGVGVTLAMSWAALLVFISMIVVLIFMQD